MLTIRYQRVGKRNYAQFKIVVAEKSAPIKGKFVEILGSRDPHQKKVVLKEERIKYWLDKGAQCSDSVFNLLVSQGVVQGPKRKINLKKKEVEEGQAEGESKKENVVNENSEATPKETEGESSSAEASTPVETMTDKSEGKEEKIDNKKEGNDETSSEEAAEEKKQEK